MQHHARRGDTTDLYFVKELSDMQNWSDQGFLVPMDDLIAEARYGHDKICRDGYLLHQHQ